MFDQETVWTLRLVVASPLHVGTGETAPLKPGDKDSPQVAVITRDVTGRPYLPGSSIKGALRALDPTALELWGEIKDTGQGRMGALTVYGAPAIGAAPSVETLPYGGVMGPDSFVSARTAIDPASGTAADHLLFHREMVAPGVEFQARLALRNAGADHAARADQVRRLLGRLQRDSLRLGAGDADGDGLLTLAQVSASRRTRADDGRLGPPAGVEAGPMAPTETVGVPSWKLTLHCSGPFLIQDSSVEPPPRQEGVPSVQIKAQRLDAAAPLVGGASISGAMRARLAWLAGRQALRAQRAGAKDPKAARDAGRTAAQLLFGTTERKAALRLQKPKASAKGLKSFTSVSLDRFTGGPLPGALFTAEAFIGAALDLELTLHDGGDQALRPLTDLLLADLSANGLDLGWGAAKGFGWFEVEIESLGGAHADG